MSAVYNSTYRAVFQAIYRSDIPLIPLIPPVTSGVIAANRNQLATTTTSITANFTSRRHHYASGQGDISNLKMIDVGFYIAATFYTVAGPNRTIKRYIEYPAGVFHQVTWDSGATSKLMTGTNIYTSDVVISSVTSEPLVIPAGTKFWERTVNLGATVSTFPIIELPAGSSTLGAEDGNSASDLGNSGTISATAGVNTFGSTCIIGDIAVANARSFLVFGDSITFGQGDVTNIGAKGGSGYVARTLDNSCYPYLKICKPGWGAATVASSTANILNLMAAINYSDFVCELGLNDITFGRSAANIYSAWQTLYGLPVTAGNTPSKIWQTTLTTRTTSTDGYMTTTNQTTKTDGTMSSLNTINDAVRALQANVTNVLEAADASMSAHNSRIWSGPFPPTLDGTHPTSAKTADMATLLSFT